MPNSIPFSTLRASTARVDADRYAVLDALADSEPACKLLARAIPEARAGKWQIVSFQIRNIRHHHRKRIIRCLMSYRNGMDPAVRTAEIIVKVYGSDRGGKALETLKQLWEGGFRSPAQYRVPRPYGYLPQEGALLQAAAPGTTWAQLLRTEDPSLGAGSARAAAWLLRLQHSGLAGGPRAREDAVESVQRWSQELAETFPRHARRLESVARRLAPVLGADGIPLAPSHGDYHPMNIFLAPALTTVIDFDTFGLREPAFDVGYAIGQLLIMSYFQTGAFGPGAGAALAFWRQYQTGGGATWDRVAVQAARTFLQSLHYELYTLHNNRLELLDLWTDLMEAWLDSGSTTILDGLRPLPLQRVQEAGAR
ncbi:MAG TPA: phosphotransferase [Anaerolineales bacterium]|nr:phosphotransferase [Anaerolineales bacterium]